MQLTRTEMLQRVPIFGALRDDALQLLLAGSREVAVGRGGHFFDEGDPALSMFVLESGQVEVVKSWQGGEVVLNLLGSGDCFGEMALMDLFPRSASVRAVADCVAIEFGSADLMQLYDSDVEQFALIQMNIGREVCRRLRAADELLFRLRMGDSPTVPGTLFGAA